MSYGADSCDYSHSVKRKLTILFRLNPSQDEVLAHTTVYGEFTWFSCQPPLPTTASVLLVAAASSGGIVVRGFSNSRFGYVRGYSSADWTNCHCAHAHLDN